MKAGERGFIAAVKLLDAKQWVERVDKALEAGDFTIAETDWQVALEKLVDAGRSITSEAWAQKYKQGKTDALQYVKSLGICCDHWFILHQDGKCLGLKDGKPCECKGFREI